MQTVRRSVAALASSAVALSAMAIATPAQAAPTTDPAPVAASAQWLVGNLKNDLIETASVWQGETFSGPSYGTSIDLALALSATGQLPERASDITDAVAASLTEYTTYEDSIYSGSSAKALALAVDQNRPVGAFGGIDLLARVESMVTETGSPSAGRLQDQDPTPDEYWADYANSIGQAFAAAALTAEGSSSADEVTGFLLGQQCEAGFFRLYFNGDKTAADQTCDGAVPAESAEQGSDTTSLVAIQLAPLAADNPAIEAALDKAGTWLLAQQRSDGGFADPSNGVNANTTGLAGWALAELGHDAAAAKAATWLRAHQVVNGCDGKLAKEAGAVAYDDQGWKDGVDYGIEDPLDRSQWIIAGVQALPALAAAPAASTGDAVTTAKFAKAGSTVSFRVEGLAAGERACVTGAAGTKSLVGTGGTLIVKAKKAKAGKRTVTLRSATDTTRATSHVLGKKKFKVKAAKKAKAGTKKRVVVRGLAGGEKVTVKVRGTKVAQGKANAKGVFVKKVSVLKKRGVAKVVVTGQFTTRKGLTTIRVR